MRVITRVQARTAAVLMPLVAVAVLAGAGCTTHSPGIAVPGGSTGACYEAIPVARGALNATSAELLGVHRVAVDHVRAHLPAAVQSELAAEDDTSVCALAFKGNFAAGQVRLAPADQSGDYALVLVSSKDRRLVASFVLTKLPKAFGGRTAI